MHCWAASSWWPSLHMPLPLQVTWPFFMYFLLLTVLHLWRISSICVVLSIFISQIFLRVIKNFYWQLYNRYNQLVVELFSMFLYFLWFAHTVIDEMFLAHNLLSWFNAIVFAEYLSKFNLPHTSHKGELCITTDSLHLLAMWIMYFICLCMCLW